MTQIFVLAEHRQGQVRDITYEMLTKARELAEKTNSELTSIILGKDVKEHAKTLAEYAKTVLLVQDAKLDSFNSETYKKILLKLITERKPLLVIMGHTSYGIELAPRLATALNTPLATDCIDLDFDGDVFTITRQIYGGKVNVKKTAHKDETYMVTIRQATFTAQKPAESANGQIIEISSPLTEKIVEKRFIEYVIPPLGEVDITGA